MVLARGPWLLRLPGDVRRDSTRDALRDLVLIRGSHQQRLFLRIGDEPRFDDHRGHLQIVEDAAGRLAHTARQRASLLAKSVRNTAPQCETALRNGIARPSA